MPTRCGLSLYGEVIAQSDRGQRHHMEGGGSSPLADLVFENNRCWDLLRNDLVENGGGRRIARLQLRQSLVCRLNLGHEDTVKAFL